METGLIFNSYEFLFAFLPVVWVVYMFLSRFSFLRLGVYWLVFSSLFFYSWWNPVYLPLIVLSMAVNYSLGWLLGRTSSRSAGKILLIFGISLNLAGLGYFKYYDFFISNINLLFDSSIPLLHLALPLAISFFTFQQIAYIVDAYRKETVEYGFFKYALFVSFFPQLIAGPIVHHREILGQFTSENRKLNYQNLSMGLFIFGIGLFKKVVLADYFAVWASAGFDQMVELSFIEAWVTSLSYTLQLYFDFSGYTDMAIGAALLFNIKLPLNFNSPYKAVNIQDFWKRWHMTLTRFLTQYLYIPLGGNRKGKIRTYLNLFLVFFLSGLWHGAGWTFLIWGTLHGLASMVNRLWQEAGFKMNKYLSWFITFQFINIAWVFFRANSWDDAIKVLKGMVDFTSVHLPTGEWLNSLELVTATGGSLPSIIFFLFAGILGTLFFRNSTQLMKDFKPTWFWGFFVAILYFVSIFSMSKVSEFLYFNF